MNNEWQDKIAVMIYIKQAIMKLDVNNLWSHDLPEIAASEEELQKTERILGYRLDNYYRDFLKSANGWKEFYQTVNLFGTKELSGSKIMKYALSLLEAVDDSVFRSIGFTKNELLPIAASEYDKDLFVISVPSSRKPGVIIWLAGEEIDRFPNFKEYYLAMLDYNRDEVHDLEEDAKDHVLKEKN